MTTIDDLREQIESEYLEPVIEETPSAPLVDDINATQLTFKILAGVLSPDDESYIAPGRLLELDYELVRVTDYDASTKTVTCRRGRRKTAAAAHTADETEVRFPTRWPRSVIERALRNSIAALWQPLFVVQEMYATIDSLGYIGLPLDTVTITSVDYQDQFGDWVSADAVLLATHPLDPAQAAVKVEPIAVSRQVCVVRYGRKVTAPSLVSWHIELLPEKWERIIIADAGAQLLAGVDIDAATQEYITEQLRLERFSARSGATISQSLIRYREYLVQQAASELVAKYPRGVQMMPINYVR